MPALHTLEVSSREILKPQLDLGGVATLLDLVDNQPNEEVFIHACNVLATSGRPDTSGPDVSQADRTYRGGDRKCRLGDRIRKGHARGIHRTRFEQSLT
jgi:hypothetical protein